MCDLGESVLCCYDPSGLIGARYGCKGACFAQCMSSLVATPTSPSLDELLALLLNVLMI